MTTKTYDKRAARSIQEMARADGNEVSYCAALNAVRADMALRTAQEPSEVRAAKVYFGCFARRYAE